MSIKDMLKIVVWSMVVWNDVNSRYMWWIVIHIGKRWYSLHSGHYKYICILPLTILRMVT